MKKLQALFTCDFCTKEKVDFEAQQPLGWIEIHLIAKNPPIKMHVCKECSNSFLGCIQVGQDSLSLGEIPF